MTCAIIQGMYGFRDLPQRARIVAFCIGAPFPGYITGELVVVMLAH
jgi:hypothetical protein